jgi:hypothetical protein
VIERSTPRRKENGCFQVTRYRVFPFGRWSHGGSEPAMVHGTPEPTTVDDSMAGLPHHDGGTPEPTTMVAGLALPRTDHLRTDHLAALAFANGGDSQNQEQRPRKDNNQDRLWAGWEERLRPTYGDAVPELISACQRAGLSPLSDLTADAAFFHRAHEAKNQAFADWRAFRDEQP